MKPISAFAVAAVLLGMAGYLWADDWEARSSKSSSTQNSTGGGGAGKVSTDNAGISSGGDRSLIQSATGGSGAGKTKPQPAARAKKGAITNSSHLTIHDQKQISGNLNGGTKGKNTYLKDASVSKEGTTFNKQSFGDGSNGGNSSPAAVDSFSKQGFIKASH